MTLQAPPRPGPPGPLNRGVRVRDAAEAAAALAAGARLGLRGTLPLVSPPGGALLLGGRMFLAMMARAEAMAPEAAGLLRPFPVLDCADAPGLALDALRLGVAAVVLRPEVPAFAALGGVAAARGLALWPAPPACAGPFPAGQPRAAAARLAWLGGGAGDSAGELG